MSIVKRILRWASATTPNPKRTAVRVKHYETFFGPVERVAHPVWPRDPHVDVYFFAPTEERPYWTLVTGGMSDVPQAAPWEPDEPLRTELIAYVERPDEWASAILIKLGEFPADTGDFLAQWHTIPVGSPVAEGSQLTVIMTTPCDLEPDAFRELEVDGETVLFLAVLPITERELEFGMEHSYPELYDRLKSGGWVRPTSVMRQSIV